MSRRVVKPRISWEDRFAAPSAAELLASLAKQHASLVQLARDGLEELGEVSESIVWHGVPWRWTFAFATEGELERPWAYLVPQPGRPLLAMPLSGETISGLPMRKLSKGVRDGLTLAALVGGVYWPQWVLASRAQVGELVGIARQRSRALATA